LDELLARPAGGYKFVKRLADAQDDVDVAPLIATANVVGLARPASLRDSVKGSRMILDVEPVSNVFACAVDRQTFAVKGIEDRQGNQLFGKMVGTIVVRTVRDDHRQAIRAVPGLCEMIRGSF